MKILVTGCTGFIGSFLAEALLAKGYEVRCLVRSSSNLRWIADLDVECHFGTLQEKDSLKMAVQEVDYIYHVAGVTKAYSEDAFLKANYEGTRQLVDAAREVGDNLQRFLYVSSLAAVGPSDSFRPVEEQSPPHPVTFYGKSKLAAEQYVLEHKQTLPVTVVRPPAVYGPRDTDVLNFFKTIKRGIIPMLGGRDQYISLIYIKDLVQGMIRAAELKKSLGRTYFLTNMQPVSWHDVARAALRVMEKRAVSFPVPKFIVDGVTRISEKYANITGRKTIVNRDKFNEMVHDFWICSGQRAKRDLNFEAKTPLKEGIRETIQWYVAQGWL